MSVVSPIYVLEVDTATRATFNRRKTLVTLQERVRLIDASSRLLEPIITFDSVGFLLAMDPTARRVSSRPRIIRVCCTSSQETCHLQLNNRSRFPGISQQRWLAQAHKMGKGITSSIFISRTPFLQCSPLFFWNTILECEATSLSNGFPLFRRYVAIASSVGDYPLTRHCIMEKRNREPHRSEHFIDGSRCHSSCSSRTRPRLYLF